MVDKIYNLRWKYFNTNQDSTLKEIFNKKNHQSDVTLVSDDKNAFQVHKFVLGASSPVLKELLISNPHSHPTVYLKGIKKIELNSILQFIILAHQSQIYIIRL